MTPEEMDEIEEKVIKLLDIDPHLHSKHHQFLSVEIEEAKTRAARNEEIRRHVMKWGIVGVLTFAVSAIYHYFTKGHH